MSSSSSSSKKKGRRKSAEDTAPDYSVEDDGFGRLVNRDKCLIWPSQNVLSKAEFESIVGKPPTRTESALVAARDFTESRIDIVQTTKRESCCSARRIFLGGCTAEQASKALAKSSMGLYYRVSKSPTPTIPLHLVFKNNTGQSFDYPLIRREQRDTLWRVDFGDVEGKEFYTLTSLMRFYQLHFCFENGIVSADTVKVWTEISKA